MENTLRLFKSAQGTETVMPQDSTHLAKSQKGAVYPLDILT
jgi:hypothetical protein